MSAYQTGSVKVVVNSPTVIGTSTEFDTYAGAGNLFRIKGEDPFYEIATIHSATKFSLSASYQNSNYSASDVLSGMPYQVVTDYTPNYSFPELGSNDINFQNIFTRAVREIDTELFNLEASNVTASSGNFNVLTGVSLSITGSSLLPYEIIETKTDNYSVVASDLGKILQMNSASAKTFTLFEAGASHDGGGIEFQKVGSGRMTISTFGAGNYIGDSSDGGTIYTETSNAVIKIKYSYIDTRWYISFANGTFVTT